MRERDDAKLVKIDVRERGAPREGAAQEMDRRLFMQLLAFRCHEGASPSGAVAQAIEGLTQAGSPGVVYADVNDPSGFAMLTWSESPSDLLERSRPIYEQKLRGSAAPRTECAMLGRTYSSGFEPDLEYWLLRRPRETVLNESWPWAVWYPLRRSGSFERLDRREQGEIVHEHAMIGRAYGRDDLAHDVRLSCHGLNAGDNDFVIGLMGRETVSAVPPPSGDAANETDVRVHRSDGAVLRRPRRLAQRRQVKLAFENL